MPLSSRQMGNRTNRITNMEGRVIFDVFQVCVVIALNICLTYIMCFWEEV